MALEVVGLTGLANDANRQPYRVINNNTMRVGWNATVTGTTGLTTGDIILLIYTGEPGSGVAQAPAANNTHPSSLSTAPTITTADGGVTSTGWVDCGYARGGNGNRQVGGVWAIKFDSSTHLATNGQVTYVRTGDTYDTHIRLLVVRGAKDDYSTASGLGPILSRSTSNAIPDQQDLEWTRPTGNGWNSTSFSGNFGSVHFAGARRSAGAVDLTAGATEVTNLFTTTTFTGTSDGTGQGGFSLGGGRQHHTTYFDMGRTSFSAFDGNNGANWTYGFPMQGGRDTNGGVSLSLFFREEAAGPITHTASGSASATFGDTAPTVTAELDFSDTGAASATFADSAPTASATVTGTTFTETPSASATFSTVSVSAEVSFPSTGTASATFADTAPTATNTIEFTVYTESVGASATLTSVDAVFTVSFAEPGSAGATFSTPSVSTSIVQGLAVGFTVSGSANGSGAVIPVSTSASALFPARQTSALTTFTRPASAGAAASITAPLAGVTSNVPIVEQVFTATVQATGSRQFTGTASASLEVKGTTQTPESSVSRKAEVFCFVTLATDTQDVMKVSASTSVSAKYNIDIVTPVSSTVTVGTSHDGGVSNYSREASAGLNILASVDQSSGSVTNASAVIDGFGSIKGPLSAIRNFTAIIDAKGSIGANLLLGADIVTITEIWNVALVELGIATVSENDSSPQAQLLSNVWNGGFRQQFLADHAFHGAKTTKSLSLFTDSSGNAVKPSGNRWSNAYELPTDYIRALTINGLAMQPNTSMGQNAWEIEIVSDGATVPTLKRCLLSNEGSVSLEYIMDIGNSNISLLSPLVAHACGLALAAHVATNFGKNPSEQQQLNQKAQDALLAAKGVDGQESSPRMFSTTSLLDVRR